MWVDRQISMNVGIRFSIIAPTNVITYKAIIHVLVPRGTMGTEEKMVKVVPQTPPH
jgi:hypothetical protein